MARLTRGEKWCIVIINKGKTVALKPSLDKDWIGDDDWATILETANTDTDKSIKVSWKGIDKVISPDNLDLVKWNPNRVRGF